MASVLKDLRYCLRVLAKAPGFTAIAVLTIAIGIGATTMIFSWMRAMLLNPVPGAADPDRVVTLETLAPSGEPLTTSFLDYRDYRDNTRLLDGVALVTPAPFALGKDTNIERHWGEMVSGNYFDMLGVKPELGRFFSGAEKDDAQNAHPVAIVSHAFWKARYGPDKPVLGAVLHINRTPFTVIGVAPPDFHGTFSGVGFDFWVPVTMYGQLTATGDWMLRDRKTRMFRVFARLKPGVTIEQARGEVQSIARRMAEANASTNQGISATILPAGQSHFGPDGVLRRPLNILLGACGVLLLIVCANIANLLLARAAGRQKEFSVRIALGAARGRLVRQVLTETLVVALLGSALGLLLTKWFGGSLAWLLPAAPLPTILQPPLDLKVLLFTMGLAVAVTILAGVAPAFVAGREGVNDMLKEAGRSGAAGRHSHRLSGVLVTSEVALAAIALIGAGLFLKSFQTARLIAPGFKADHVAVTQFSLSTARYTAAEADVFCRKLREKLETEPGVSAVTYADWVPLGLHRGSWEDLQIEGYVPGSSENMKIYRTLVAPGYFTVMKIPLLQGRDFDLQDDAKSLPVIIVNQEFLRRFLPNQNPIGRKVRGWGRWFTIVGVARDSKYYQLTESPQPYFYIPIRQIYRPEMGLTFFVRTSGSVDEAIALVRRDARSLDPSLPVFDAMPLTEYITASLFGQKLAATLLSVLGGIALLLAAVGLYGVLAYSVAQRTNEIGIRVTLGAQPSDVLRMVLRQGLTFTLVGLVIGSVIAAFLARLGSAVLVAISPLDVSVYTLAGLFTVIVALISTSVPAVRALRVDPMVAIRGE